MYLIDTNVWLERLLEQTKSEEVRHFLDITPTEHLFITDFAFHSLGVVMRRLDHMDAFLRFVKDAFIEGEVVLVRLYPEDRERLADVIRRFNLDFDDAYQYVSREV
jgi:predicted nucleic acid-binding protein